MIQDTIKLVDEDNITITTNNIKTPITEEEIQKASRISAQAKAIVAEENPIDFTDEELKELGVTYEQVMKQLEFNKTMELKNEAQFKLGNILGTIYRSNPDMPDYQLYTGLLDHLLDIVSSVYSKYNKLAEEELISIVKDILKKETSGEYYIHPDDRIEALAIQKDSTFLDRLEDQDIIYISKQLQTVFEQLDQEESEDTMIAVKLVDFAVNTGCLEISEERYNELIKYILTEDIQQSIVWQRTTQKIIDNMLSNCKEDLKSSAEFVINSIFIKEE